MEEREGKPLLSLPLSPSSSDPSFAFGQVMQITLLNKKSKHAALLPLLSTATSLPPLLSLSHSIMPMAAFYIAPGLYLSSLLLRFYA